MVLVIEHLIFSAAGTSAFLAANFFAKLDGFGLSAENVAFDFLDQPAPRQVAVDGLRPVVLAFHKNTRRPMEELNATGRFVHMLPARTTRTYERLVDILLRDAERLHFLAQRGFFLRRNHLLLIARRKFLVHALSDFAHRFFGRALETSIEIARCVGH